MVSDLSFDKLYNNEQNPLKSLSFALVSSGKIYSIVCEIFRL